MPQEPLISAIIPVYNAEKYLPECVESVLGQTYTNLEIILVDDGSPDRSPEICDEYAAKDSRVKVIHKPNSGQVDVRNTALDIAAGEYITFIDSDDWIESDMIEFLYKLLVQHDADISLCGVYRSYVGINILPERDRTPPWKHLVLSGFDAAAMAFSTTFDAATWAKLYKKTIFETYRYPQARACDDALSIVHVLMLANTVVIDMTPKYYYRKRKTGIVHRVSRTTRTRHRLEAFEKRQQWVERDFPGLVPIGEAFLYRMYIDALGRFISASGKMKSSDSSDLEFFHSVLERIKENAARLQSNVYLTRGEKLNLRLIKKNVRLQRLYVKICSLIAVKRWLRRRRTRKYKKEKLVLFD